MKWIVYAHRNIINNKLYIGITSKSPDERFGKDGRGYRNQVFFNAIQKYGWDKFEHIILFDNLPYNIAADIEYELIEKLKLRDPRCGYNISKGGLSSVWSTEEQYMHMRKVKEGKPGNKWTDEHRQKFHDARVGHVPSQKSIESIKNLQGKKVKIVELNMEFRSIRECSEYLSVTKRAVQNCLQEKSSSCKKYHIIYSDI